MVGFVHTGIEIETRGGWTELFCPSGNTEYNALWPSNVTAGTLVQGAYCAPGWTGSIGRQCQLSGQWAPNAVGGCTRTWPPM
jgi:hypothetical protein